MANDSAYNNHIQGEFPRRIEIELSSLCNLRCVYCPRKFLGDLNGFIKLPLFKRIIDEASAYPQTILVLHRRGESLMHPDFIEICGCLEGKFKEVQLATNATLLDEAKIKALIKILSFISFSIDIPQVFDKVRVPAIYKDTEEKILRFLELNNGQVKTQVSMVKTPDTTTENIELFKRIWQKKVDVVRIYEEHSLDGKFGSLNRKRDNRVACVMPFYELLIFCDGKIGRCNHDWNGSPMGDVDNLTIKQIWDNRLYSELRGQHKQLKITDKVCKDCDCWYPKIGMQDTGEVRINA